MSDHDRDAAAADEARHEAAAENISAPDAP